MTEAVSAERQSQLLDEAVLRASLSGGRLVSKAGSLAVVEFGQKPNHVLHAILSVGTCGLWLLVWLFLSMTNKGVSRRTVMVDEWGRAWIDGGGQWESI